MFTIVIVFVLFSLVTIRVKGQGELDFAADRELYEQLEDEYTQHLKNVELMLIMKYQIELKMDMV